MPTAELVIIYFIHNPGLNRILVNIPQKYHEISHIIHRLTLETFPEQMAVSRILVILYPCIIAVPYQGTLNLKKVDFVFLLLARHSSNTFGSAPAACVGSGDLYHASSHGNFRSSEHSVTLA